MSDRVLRLQTPSAAEVTIEIVPAPVERNLQGLTISSRSLEPGLRVTIEPVNVTVGVRGSEALLGDVEESGVDAFIDLAGLPAGRYNLPVTVASSADIGITHIDPPNVVVILQ